jgi:hypothetical protein
MSGGEGENEQTRVFEVPPQLLREASAEQPSPARIETPPVVNPAPDALRRRLEHVRREELRQTEELRGARAELESTAGQLDKEMLRLRMLERKVKQHQARVDELLECLSALEQSREVTRKERVALESLQASYQVPDVAALDPAFDKKRWFIRHA